MYSLLMDGYLGGNLMKKERNGKDIDGEHRFEAVCFEAGLAIICEERFCLGDVNLCERHIKQLFQKFKVLI